MDAPGSKARRLVIVSGRLPVNPKPDKTPPVEAVSAYSYTSTVLGIAGELDFEEIVWIGWPGVVVTDKAEEERCTEVLHASSFGIRFLPIWLTKDEVDRFFNGFCNSSLWPLLHWMTPYAHFKQEWAETYWIVNERFAEAVRKTTEEDDVVWVHDYHLFLLPQFLREPSQGLDNDSQGGSAPDLWRNSSRDVKGTATTPTWSPSVSSAADPSLSLPVHRLRIVLFLHTPFPSYEVLSVHPQCNMLLEGALGADLIGFHTYMYLRHFRSSILRVLGFSTELDRIDHQGMRTKLGVFPIGPNVKGIDEVMKKDAFSEHLRDYNVQYEGKNVVLSVERLDYSKGLPQKMAAIRRYLEQAQQNKDGKAHHDHRLAAQLDGILQEKKAKGSRREMLIRMGASMMKAFASNAQPTIDHTKTVFVFIAIPSKQREGDVKYQAMEEQVQQTVSEINGLYSTPTHQPIVYIYREVSACELYALYARADCCLVTPLIDGMNLVAKEFLVAKDRSLKDRSTKVVPGLVVISELTGAAQELFDALVVNPHDENAVAQAITFALELDMDDRWVFTDNMRLEVMKNDAGAWADGILANLQAPDPLPLASDGVQEELASESSIPFRRWQEGVKALFLDYSGTLDEADAPTMSAETKAICVMLNERSSSDGDLTVYIMSRHEREVLEELFSDFPNLTLVAEDGSFLHRPGEKQRWEAYCPSVIAKWKELVKPVMQLFVRSTPGSKIEVHKTTTITWCYSKCDTVYGEFKAHELVHLLSQSLVSLPCQVTLDTSAKTVEVESLQANKGVVVQSAFDEFETANGEPFSAVFCAGDDRTDEAAFLAALSLGKHRPGTTIVTVKVGGGESHAQFRVGDPAEMRKFLKSLLGDEDKQPQARWAHKRASHSSNGVAARHNTWKESSAGRISFATACDSPRGPGDGGVGDVIE
mmetsp:Transcript_11410/g.26364  ORF Transcript_11410/g.26364 Transcript_11410/m.26364 type:complete len:930 (+) Transcript_11410:97-2886(+)